MGSELSTLVQSGSGSLVTVITADLWVAVKKILVRVCRGVRRGSAGIPGRTETEHQEPAAERPVPVQSNTARDSGIVFAVQHGDQRITGANWRER